MNPARGASAVQYKVRYRGLIDRSQVAQYTFAGAEMLLHLDLSSNRLDGVDGAFTRLKELSK